MNPETKIILDELMKKFDAFESKWGAHFSESEEKLETRFKEAERKFESCIKETEDKLESRYIEREEQLEAVVALSDDRWERRLADVVIARDARVAGLECAVISFDEWKPDIEGSLEDIRLEVGKISKNWERAVMDPRLPPVLPTPASSPAAAQRPHASSGAVRPIGNQVANSLREDGFGSFSNTPHSPTNGAFRLPTPQLDVSVLPTPSNRWKSASPGCGNSSKLPKLNFPVFDGENPKLWLSRSVDYFELYDVEPDRWIVVASMHFVSPASQWLQSVQRKIKSCSWSQFSDMVIERFGREEHEILVRQLFHIKQTTTVADYVDRFSSLIDQLSAYEHNPDPLHYTMRFIDGLTEEFRGPVLIQRPSDLDTAFVIAKLQEEVSVPTVQKEFKRSVYSYSHKQDNPVSLPLPPWRDKPGVSLPEDRRGTESSRARSVSDRWSNLKAYRRAQGLCQNCAEKWSRDHKCADKVQLHVLQELVEVIAAEATSNEADESAYSPSEQLFFSLSSAAVSGVPAPRTMCMTGVIQGKPMRILVDSGSSHTFINSQLAQHLVGVLPISSSVNVQVANGQSLKCTSQLLQTEWVMEGYQFKSDLKVISLAAFDMILGLDWLECHSPMKVHWRHKWMAIPYQGSTVLLYGDNAVPPEGSVVQICSVQISVEDSIKVAIPEEVQQLIEEFGVLFQVPTELPPQRAFDHSIPLVEGAAPVRSRPYRFAPALKDEIEKQVQEMLKIGLIQPSNSPFTSLVLLVKKKDGTWRFCVDFRHLNAITLKGQFPVPIIDEFLDELSHASWFSSLDLTAGFHQIRLKAGEEYKTAFQTHFGQFEFWVMPFGLTGAPGTFQLAMNTTLAPFLRKFVLVFFDDILTYSRSYEEHVQHIRLVFELLQQDQWKIKLTKCSFAQRKIHYLGHVISDAGVGTDPQKVTAIAEWPIPANAKELRSFLGLAGYYRKFVRNFGVISKVLTELLKKNVMFVWTSEHTKSFEALKHALTHAPVLALPDFSQPFVIETDASGSSIGVVLMQAGHPLAFFSKALGPKSKGLSTYEKEYMAIFMAVQQWRPYLQHGEFLIHTDQRSLSMLSEQRLHTEWQQKVFTKLLGLQYRIVHKKGAENKVADALSRKSTHDASCSALSSSIPKWIEEVVEGYQHDDKALSMIAKLVIDPQAIPQYTLHDGILRFNNRIWIGDNPALQQKLIQACHSSALGGHSGAPVTYMRMKNLFAWTGMKSSVLQFVQSCLICQQAKPDRSKLPGKLQPLPVPDSAWQIISMDFVEGLPTSGHANCILVVIDSFTKYGHFVPLHHPYTAASVAKLFMSNVYKYHGMPISIISDRDRIFNSKLWKELFGLAGVQLQMSSSYHPQSDGQTERANQTMETFLRCFVSACPSKWVQWIALAEFWYNSCQHSAIGRSPFEALYGYSPRHFGISAADAIQTTELSSWLKERDIMNNLIKQHLCRAKLRMKRQADKHRSERKLAFKFFGPFQILAKVGSVAYKLLLPPSSSIHPVFHVSQLKKVVAPNVEVIPIVPDAFDVPRVPEAVLQKRVISKGVSVVTQVLIKWSGWPSAMATWEDLVCLQQKFPYAPAWGQADSQGGGDVSTVPSTDKDQEEVAAGPRTSARERKPNSRVTGPEWL
ncbi:unnamed protein product [Urochloa humidicola]